MTLAEDCYFVHLTECPPSKDAKYSVAKEPQIEKFFHVNYLEYEQELMGKNVCLLLEAE